jgi:WD40 repeat protein
MFLMVGLVAFGLVITSESVVCWRACDPEYLTPGNRTTHWWVRGLTWSVDGNTLFSESRGEPILEFKLTAHDMTLPDGRSSVREESLAITAIEVSLSANARKVLLTTERGNLSWVDLVSLETSEFNAPPSAIFKMPAVAHNARMLAAASNQGTVYLSHATQETLIACESSESEQVTRLRFSNDDHKLMACRSNGRIEIWDTRTGTLRHCLSGESGPVTAAFLQDGTKVISSLGGNCVQITDLKTGEVCWSEPHGLREKNVVWRLETSPDGSLVAWSGIDNQVVICDLEHSRKRIEFDNPSHVSNISFSPNNRYLAVAGSEPVIRIYDTTTGREDRRIDTRLAYSKE